MTTIALDPKEGFFIAELYPAAQDLLPIANLMDTKSHFTAHSHKAWGLDYDYHVQMKSIITHNAKCVMGNFCTSWLINQIHLFLKITQVRMTAWLKQNDHLVIQP